jgi:hypothetical protein
MSFLQVTWLRPVVALAALAALALWLTAAGPSSAGLTADVTITPADGEVGEGSTIDVDVNINPNGAEVAVWIIEFEYDETVLQVVPGPDCSTLTIPQGVVGAGLCDVKDNGGGAGDDTGVALGGYIENDQGTAHGFSGNTTVATFSFMAVGNAGDETDLSVSFTNLLNPDGNEFGTTDTDGHVTIIEVQGEQVIFGDVDCSDSLSVLDGRKVVLAVVNAPAAQPQGCPAINADVSINGNNQKFGDVDCSGGLSVLDGRKVVLAVVNAPAAQPQGCPAIGSMVTLVV